MGGRNNFSRAFEKREKKRKPLEIFLTSFSNDKVSLYVQQHYMHFPTKYSFFLLLPLPDILPCCCQLVRGRNVERQKNEFSLFLLFLSLVSFRVGSGGKWAGLIECLSSFLSLWDERRGGVVDVDGSDAHTRNEQGEKNGLYRLKGSNVLKNRKFRLHLESHNVSKY